MLTDSDNREAIVDRPEPKPPKRSARTATTNRGRASSANPAAPRRVVRSISFLPNELNTLQEIAVIEDRPVSYLVQQAVDQYISRWIAANPLKINLFIQDSRR